MTELMKTVYLTQQEVDDIPFLNLTDPEWPVAVRWKQTSPEGFLTLYERTPDLKVRTDSRIVVVTVAERIQMEVDKIMKLKAAAPPVPTAGPMMTDLSKRVPDIMGELMKDFVERRDLNSRAQIRLRMKALLDLFSADTGYPPIPALSPSSRQGRGAFAAAGNQGDYMQVAPQMMPPLRMGGEADMLQREVQQAVDDQRAAAEPVDLVPAPGAPVALGRPEHGVNPV